MTPKLEKKQRKDREKKKLNALKGKGKKGTEDSAKIDTALEGICNVVRFRSQQPKVIDLTSEERMPETLNELATRCKKEQKDLYMYYYLSKKVGESCIIFCNSITCTKRVSSVLNFLKVKNWCLHSKMQQKARLKSLDRFKIGVQRIENGGLGVDSAVLVCTDVAARGLDIPNVQNVLHY